MQLISYLHINFSLKFMNPTLVSIGEIPDVLQIKIVDTDFFSDSESGITVDPDFSITKNLPIMLKNGEFAQNLELASATVEKGVQTGLVTQIIICVILSASLKSLWNFLNVVQVLAYIRFFAIWPATMMVVFI